MSTRTTRSRGKADAPPGKSPSDAVNYARRPPAPPHDSNSGQRGPAAPADIPPSSEAEVPDAEVLDVCGHPITLARLEQLAPHLAPRTRQTLLNFVRALRDQCGHLVELASLKCYEAADTTPELRRQVQLTDHATGTQLLEVIHQGEQLHPYQLTREGVDLRGRFLVEFDSIPMKHLAEVDAATKERAAAIAHCQKRLIELPVILRQSREVFQTHCMTDGSRFPFATMTFQHSQIKREIEALHYRRQCLLASPQPRLDQAKSVLRGVQAMMQLGFGLNLLGERMILVTRSPDNISFAPPAWLGIACV